MPRVIPQGPNGTTWFGGDPDEIRLCLRVCGDALEPDTVSRILGHAPSRCQRKGEPVRSPGGEIKRIARTGSWLLDYPVGSDATVEDAIRALLARLPADPSVWAALTSEFRVDLICDITVRSVNRGFELSPEVLGLVAQRGVVLGFDIVTAVDAAEAEALQQRLSPG